MKNREANRYEPLSYKFNDSLYSQMRIHILNSCLVPDDCNMTHMCMYYTYTVHSHTYTPQTHKHTHKCTHSEAGVKKNIYEKAKKNIYTNR